MSIFLSACHPLDLFVNPKDNRSVRTLLPGMPISALIKTWWSGTRWPFQEIIFYSHFVVLAYDTRGESGVSSWK
jgi:hypothetical protein